MGAMMFPIGRICNQSGNLSLLSIGQPCRHPVYTQNAEAGDSFSCNVAYLLQLFDNKEYANLTEGKRQVVDLKNVDSHPTVFG